MSISAKSDINLQCKKNYNKETVLDDLLKVMFEPASYNLDKCSKVT